MGDDLTPNETLDGLALWDEHKPQSREDWIGVVRRVYAAGPPENPSPLFGALYDAWAEVERQRDAIELAVNYLTGNGNGQPYADGVDLAVVELVAALDQTPGGSDV